MKFSMEIPADMKFWKFCWPAPNGPHTGGVRIFWHIFTGSHQMVLCTGRVRKTVILVTTLTVGYQMFPNTSWLMKMHILTPLCNLATRWGIHNLTGEKYIFLAPLFKWDNRWSHIHADSWKVHFLHVPQNRLTGEKFSFLPYFVNGPPYRRSCWKVPFCTLL